MESQTSWSLGQTDELASSLAAGKDARATVVRASCPDSEGLNQFRGIQAFPGTAQDV